MEFPRRCWDGAGLGPADDHPDCVRRRQGHPHLGHWSGEENPGEGRPHTTSVTGGVAAVEQYLQCSRSARLPVLVAPAVPCFPTAHEISGPVLDTGRCRVPQREVVRREWHHPISAQRRDPNSWSEKFRQKVSASVAVAAAFSLPKLL